MKFKIYKNRIKCLLPVLLSLLILTGCNDWLTIDPKSEIDADVLFETPQGFSIALNGIYSNLSSRSLYGKELKHGFTDVLAHLYTINHPTYQVLETYDYDAPEIKRIIENIWAVSYNTIANCNSLLQRVAEKDSTFFPEAGKRMVEGEALAIRALLYFDILRLFAPNPSISNLPSVPYYDQLTNKPMPYLSANEIISKIITDLIRSKKLQKQFDTSEEAISYMAVNYRFNYTKGFYGNSRRGYRMGYYAATALLAQVALYAGDNALALENAMELIEGPSTVNFTPSDKIESNNYDRLLSDDLIFGLYNREFEEYFDEHNFLISNVDNIFGNDGDDFRKRCFLLNLGDKVQLSKFVLTENNKLEGSISYTIPMFRLSQMYHIAIETMFDTNPTAALGLFSTLRTRRGCKTPLPDILTKSDLLTFLVNDARREFIGEGQLFYIYKRLNREVIDEKRGNKTLTKEFIIPVPDRETSITNF